MRLLDRYLLRELLIPLGYCLCGFLIFWVFSDLFTSLADFQKKKLLAWDIAEYYLVSMPEFLVVVVPIALLLALLYALTNHARHHEIKDGQLIRRSVGGGGPQELQGPCARIGLFMNHSPRVQLVREDFAIGGVVVDDQRVQSIETW